MSPTYQIPIMSFETERRDPPPMWVSDLIAFGVVMTLSALLITAATLVAG